MKRKQVSQAGSFLGWLQSLDHLLVNGDGPVLLDQTASEALAGGDVDVGLIALCYEKGGDAFPTGA